MTAEWTPDYGLETETRARPGKDAKDFRIYSKTNPFAKNKVTLSTMNKYNNTIYIYQLYINKKLILYIRIYNKHTKKRQCKARE